MSRPLVAALFVEPAGCYAGLDCVDPWPASRDARLYAGPHPVVAHPPCSRWCRLAGLVEARWGHKRGEDGGCFASALASVRRYGGVLEHPAYSDAWKAFALPVPPRRGWIRGLCGGWSCHVEQGRYGHPAKKATWLYAFGINPPPMLWGEATGATALMSWCGNHLRGAPDRPRIAKRAASRTPHAFRDALLAMARGVALAIGLAACARVEPSPVVETRVALACTAPVPPWDVVGLVAMGQSCATGYVPPGVAGTTLSTEPEGNLMLTDPSGAYAPGGAELELAPYVEPMRPGSPASNIAYPANLAPGCEPPSAYAVNHVHALWRARGWPDVTFGVTNVGVGGASIVHIGPGGDWRSYSAALEEVEAWVRVLAERGQSYGVLAVVLTHGEFDVKRPSYRQEVVALYDAFDANVRSITGQTQPVIMLASQQSSVPGGLEGSPVQLLGAADDRPGRIVVTGPRYQLWAWRADTKHFTAEGYQRLGAQYGHVLDLLLRGQSWSPLAPVAAWREASAVRVRYHVPVPPLAWDTAAPDPWPPGGRWALGRGFEVRAADGSPVRILGATIEPPDVVRLDLASAPVCPCAVSYATTGVRGQLADSEGEATAEGYALRAYAVHSVVEVP